MSKFRTVLRGALFAILWTNAGLVIATEVPAEASADADERSMREQRTPDATDGQAAAQSEQHTVAAHEVKTMVESDVRLELSQRLAILAPPS